jgi:ABC-type glycerol-3-phosphate transport system permease component
MGLVLPFPVWMLKTYTDTIDKELEEAALIDGASRLQIITRVVLPLITPAMVSVGMFSFLAAWNHLLYVLILDTTNSVTTVPLGLLVFFIQNFNYYYSDATASMMIVSVPIVVIFIALQKYFVSGLTAGATKG